MAPFQQGCQFVDVSREEGHFVLIGDYSPSAQNVMSIFGTSFGDMALENNIRSLIDGELGPFDKV